MANQIIVKGKLDLVDGTYLLTDEATLKTRYLFFWLDAYLGKTIVISLEREEPVLNHSLKELLVEA